MGRPLRDELELPLPAAPDTDGDGEALGIENDTTLRDDVVAQDDESESLGLDHEAGLTEGFDIASLIAPASSEEETYLDDRLAPLDGLEQGLIHEDDEEEGWTTDSESGPSDWEPDGLDEETDSALGDDGSEGLEDLLDDGDLDDDPAPDARERGERGDDEDDDSAPPEIDDDWPGESPSG